MAIAMPVPTLLPHAPMHETLNSQERLCAQNTNGAVCRPPRPHTHTLSHRRLHDIIKMRSLCDSELKIIARFLFEHVTVIYHSASGRCGCSACECGMPDGCARWQGHINSFSLCSIFCNMQIVSIKLSLYSISTCVCVCLYGFPCHES